MKDRDDRKNETAKDALERTKRELTKVRREKDRLEATLAAIGDGVRIMSTDFKILYQNQVDKDIVGDHTGELCYKAFQKRDEVCKGCHLSLCFEDGKIHTRSQERTTDKGKKFNEITASPLRDSRGTIVAGIEVIRDVTRRRVAEEELKDSEEKFRAIMATAADAIIVMNSEGKIEYWNPAAEEIFGYSGNEVKGKELHLFLSPTRYYEAYQKGFGRFAKTGEGPAIGNTLEFVAVNKEGREFPIEVSVSAIHRKGQWYAVGMIRDVTERKEMEEAVLRIRKLESIGVLAGGIAHDFNNLLQTILGNITLAKMRVQPNDKIYDRLEDAEKASLQARELSCRLLTFSEGGDPIKRSALMGALLRQSVYAALHGPAVSCEFDIADDLFPVAIDEGQINQVVQNLIFNAQEAMPAGGTMHVRAKNLLISGKNSFNLKEGRYVEVSIEDHGVGIPEEILPKIFDPYFTTKGMGSQKGEGLGLAICHSIIKKHGGIITAESQVGSGTTLYVYLPASLDRQ